MLFILEPADAMPGFPRMYEHLGILRFITNAARESAMIFMRVGEHDAANVGDAQARLAQPFMQGVVRFFGFGTGVDERERIFRDQIDVDRANVEWRRQRDGDDAHLVSYRLSFSQ